MTPEQRLKKIAAILSVGLVRLLDAESHNKGTRMANAPHVPPSPESINSQPEDARER